MKRFLQMGMIVMSATVALSAYSNSNRVQARRNQAAVRSGAQGGVAAERQKFKNGEVSRGEAMGAVYNYRNNARKGVVSRER
jgi:hypothetical protein